MQFPIIIGLRRSFFADAVLVLVTALALGVIALANWPPLYRIFALVALLLMAWRAAMGLRPVASALKVQKSGKVSILKHGKGEEQEVTLQSPLFIHPWLTVFRARCTAGESFAFALFFDSAANDDLRRLRVILRWQSPNQTSDA